MKEFYRSVKASVLYDTRFADGPSEMYSPVTKRESKLIKRRSRAAKVYAANVRPGLFSKRTQKGYKRSDKARRSRLMGNISDILFRTKETAKREKMYIPNDIYQRQAESRTTDMEWMADSARRRRTAKYRFRRVK